MPRHVQLIQCPIFCFAATAGIAPCSPGNNKTSVQICIPLAPNSAPPARSTNPIHKTRDSFPRAGPPPGKIPAPLSAHSCCRNKIPARPEKESAGHLAQSIVHRDISRPPIPEPSPRTLARSPSVPLHPPVATINPDFPGGIRLRAARPTFHSTQVRTVLNPSPLIFSRSSFHNRAESSLICSSIGARALPPLYHTDTGKNSAAFSAAAPASASVARATSLRRP